MAASQDAPTLVCLPHDLPRCWNRRYKTVGARPLPVALASIFRRPGPQRMDAQEEGLANFQTGSVGPAHSTMYLVTIYAADLIRRSIAPKAPPNKRRLSPS